MSLGHGCRIHKAFKLHIIFYFNIKFFKIEFEVSILKKDLVFAECAVCGKEKAKHWRIESGKMEKASFFTEYGKN